jgi:hypothetical protein
MEGSRYVDGVLVTTIQLTRTETTKAAQILANRITHWEVGIHEGLVLSVNAVNQNRLDLTPGNGYAPNGERVVLSPLAGPGSAGALNIALADPNLGALNYVYLVYTELKTGPMPHETNGQVYPTNNQASAVVRVFTAAQFAALPLSDPSYQQDARDRAMLVGIVTGTGGNLTPGNLQQPPAWRTLKYATVAAPGLGGVTISAVGDSTPEGSNGQLTFAVGPLSLSWQAPGEAGPGPAVLTPAEGFYTLTALGGSTIQVYVVVTGLPAAGTVVQVAITGLYTQQVPRASNTDRHHRSLLGTGTPTPQNPHGLSIEDIAPGFVDELRRHQQNQHANGIWRGSAATFLRPSVNEVAGIDSVNVVGPAGEDTYYVFGLRKTSVVNSVVSFADLVPAETAKQLYQLYVDASGNVGKHKRAAFVSAPSNILGLENQIVFVSDTMPAGTYPLTYTSAGAGAGGTLQWNGGVQVVIPATLDALVGGYFRLFNGVDEVDVFIGDVGVLLGLPAGVYTDQITIFAPVDARQNLVLGQVAWQGAGTGSLGYTPQRGTVAAKLLDLRLFGNLAEAQLRDDLIREKLELPLAEHSPDGVVIGQMDVVAGGSLAVVAGVGLAVDVLGVAPVYVRGRRLVVEGTTGVVVPDNTQTLLYLDQAGVYRTAPVTDLPAFLSPGKTAWSVNQQEFPAYGAALALITTAGGAVTDVIDLRRNLSGGNVSIEPWSVGRAASPTDALGEFLDLRGAVLYARYAGTQPALHLLDCTLNAPLAIDGVNQLWGGILRLGPNLFASAPAAAISFGAGTTPAPDMVLTVRDVRMVQDPAAPNAAASSVFTFDPAGAAGIVLENVNVNLTANVHSLVRLGGGFARLSKCRVESGGGAQGPLVHLTATADVSLDQLVTEEASAFDGLVRTAAAAITARVQARDLTGAGLSRLAVLGAGSTLTQSSFESFRGYNLPSGASVTQTRYESGVFAGAITVDAHTDVRFARCRVQGNLTLSNGTRVLVADSNVTGDVLYSTMIDLRFERVEVGGNVQPGAGTNIRALFADCQINGGTGFSLTAGTHHRITIERCAYNLFSVGVGVAFLADTQIRNNGFTAIQVLWSSNDTIQNLLVEANQISGTSFLRSSNAAGPGFQSKLDLRVVDNEFRAIAPGTAGQPFFVGAATGVLFCRNVVRDWTPSGEGGLVRFGGDAPDLPVRTVVCDDNLFVVSGDGPGLAGIVNFGPPVVALGTSFGGALTSVSRNTFRFEGLTAARQMVCILHGAGSDNLRIQGNEIDWAGSNPFTWALPSATFTTAGQIALFIAVQKFPLQAGNETGYTAVGNSLRKVLIQGNLTCEVFAVSPDKWILAQLDATPATMQQVVSNTSGATTNVVTPAGATVAQNT